MACMDSEEGCSLCASRSLVSLPRHYEKNVAVANGLYDTAVRCRVGSCVATERYQ